MTVQPVLLKYLMALVAATRESEFLALGVSTRGAMSLYRGSQAMAFLRGRDYVTPDDVKSLAVPSSPIGFWSVPSTLLPWKKARRYGASSRIWWARSRFPSDDRASASGPFAPASTSGRFSCCFSP